MRGLLLTAGALAWSTAAWGQGEQVDLRAYAATSLQKALAGTPRSLDAAYELETDQRLRLEAAWTGNARKPAADLVPLLTAWMQRRQRTPGPGPAVDPLALDRFAELELEDAGTRHWLLLGYPAIMTMSSVNPGQRQTMLVHRIGFAHGRPVAVIYLMTTPERMRAMEAAPPPASAPPQAREARPQPLASGRYGRGEVRFVYAGKPYALAASTPKDAKGNPRPHPSQFEKHRDSRGDTFDAVSLDFGHPGPVEATLSFHARGPGEYTELDIAGLDFNYMAGGVFLHLTARDFPGCTLKLAQVDAARIAGRIDCPQPPASGVSSLEFAVSP